MSEPEIKMTILTGTMPFVEPKYHIEPCTDLRGRHTGYAIVCDVGTRLVGFSSQLEAIQAARAAGMKLNPNQPFIRDHYENEDPQISYGAFGCIVLAIFWLGVAGAIFGWKWLQAQ